MNYISGLSEKNNDSTKLIVFDMDSTLIDAETIDELAKAAGVGQEVSAITERAMKGEIDFSQALTERVKLLKGLALEDATTALDKMPLMPGAKELINFVKSVGYTTAMVSGGFTLSSERVGKLLGIDHIVSNELIVEDGIITGEVVGSLTAQNSKELVLEEIAAQHGIAPEDCIVVGDGANDICIFKRARYAIAFNSKPVLRQHADIVIIEKNLKAVIPVIESFDLDQRCVSCIRNA
ncbi:phosphoserine phosphatase SerB [uncultured Methanomethylovorans sp.]|uniref:phosphoserine phosphatase SerB n=1 Tax=uncultured Methanomethylovorans sp. TaxID=183759 RepID=UPI002AA7AD84|nr:phosphoserine phosphatase SerB [uncultured Methanomethylovorans sp.]